MGAFDLDFLTQIVNVKWGASEGFTYASAASTNLFQFWGVFGGSSDGKEWETLNSLINTSRCTGLSTPPERHQVPGGPATYLTCSIRGKSGEDEVIIAGGGMGWPSVDVLGNPDMTIAAVLMVSNNGGVSWKDASFPVGPAGINQFNQTKVLTVGYNKKANMFYATTIDTLWDVTSGSGGVTNTFLGNNYRTYSSSTGFGWAHSSETFVASPGEATPLLPYPDETNVCSMFYNLPAQETLKYCTSSGPNQILQVTDDEGEDHSVALSDLDILLIDGKPVQVAAMIDGGTAVACGRGLIIFAGYGIQLESSDIGKTWHNIAQLDLVSADQSGFAPCITCS